MHGTIDAARIFPPLTWIAEPIEVVIDPATITATIRTSRPGHDSHTMTVQIPGRVAYPDPARHAIADLDLRSTEAWINETAQSWLDIARPGRNRQPLAAHLEFDTTIANRRIRMYRTGRFDKFYVHRASNPTETGMVTRSLRATTLHQLLGIIDLAAELPDYQVDRDPDMPQFAPIGDAFPLGTRITTARRIDLGDMLLGIPEETADQGIRIKPLPKLTRVHDLGRLISNGLTEFEFTIDGPRGNRVQISTSAIAPFAVSHIL